MTVITPARGSVGTFDLLASPPPRIAILRVTYTKCQRRVQEGGRFECFLSGIPHDPFDLACPTRGGVLSPAAASGLAPVRIGAESILAASLKT